MTPTGDKINCSRALEDPSYGVVCYQCIYYYVCPVWHEESAHAKFLTQAKLIYPSARFEEIRGQVVLG